AQWIYEIVIERIEGILAERGKQQSARDNGQYERDDRRNNAEKNGTLRPLDQFDAHHAAPRSSCATWPGSAPPMNRPIFSKVASAIGICRESRPLCMTAMASQISNNSSRSWLMTRIAEPLRAR